MSSPPRPKKFKYDHSFGDDRAANASRWTSSFSRDQSDSESSAFNFKVERSRLSGSESDDQLSPLSLPQTPSYAAFMTQSHESSEAADEGTSNMYSSFARKQMESMGYKEGGGLGKHGQGMPEFLEASKQKGRRGLGFTVKGFDEEVSPWDEDKVELVEKRDFIPTCPLPPPTMDEMTDWIVMGEKVLSIERETEYCDEEVLQDILSSKTVFDALGGDEFLRARTRANPYELIRGAIFQNRAAMKMANIDSAFDFMFTDPKNERGDHVVGPNDLLYFADLCAGPGGFSEYVLWRKKWHAKGYGFTLKGDNDFKLENFFSGSPETFQPHYGVGGRDGDGDIFKEENIEEFKNFVLQDTHKEGVHFVMADGGFSVEGQENIQEILSKQLYLCQFLLALLILRKGGHFMCKLFDLFTPFSIGLIYLLYRAFDEICIFKPITSRPANSERYVVCKGLRRDITDIQDYLFNVNVRLNRLKETKSSKDILQVVPMEVINSQKAFVEYIRESNNRLGMVQTNSLRKIKAFVQDPSLMGQYDQAEIRTECLKLWKIPDQARASSRVQDIDAKFSQLWKESDDSCFSSQPTQLSQQNLHNLRCIYDYKCLVSGGERCFLLGVGRTTVYKWDGRPCYRSSHWSKLDKCQVELPRDTLIEVEIVQELHGEGKGQRRSSAIYILDAIILGGDDVREHHYRERMSIAQTFSQALRKSTRPDLAPLRVNQSFRVEFVKQIFSSLEKRLVKGRREPQQCFSIEDERYFVPRGIYFIKHIQEPWTHCFSKSRKKLYFHNKQKNESTYDCPKESVASFKTSLMSRYVWPWDNLDTEQSSDAKLDHNQLLDFIHVTLAHIVGS